MPRLMSVSLTEAAVVRREKTVTRRLGWRMLKPGDQLQLCRKVMGRCRQDGTVDPLVRLALVEVIDVRRERVWDITDDDIVREAVDPDLFDEWWSNGQPTPTSWVQWFCEQMDCRPDDEITRIEWRYLEAPPRPPGEKITDLMAALEESVREAKEARKRHPQPAPDPESETTDG